MNILLFTLFRTFCKRDRNTSSTPPYLFSLFPSLLFYMSAELNHEIQGPKTPITHLISQNLSMSCLAPSPETTEIETVKSPEPVAPSSKNHIRQHTTALYATTILYYKNK